MIGQTLGHYRIVSKMGAGGMGEVYSARDERLERDVALKILPAGALTDEAARKRFRKEALALSKLNHSNIATIHDFDTDSGVDFLVMEYVIGETLAEKVARGATPEKEAVALGGQIAESLEEAHEHGIVHRDLKPSNIMVTPKGRVKVLDFGLAKLLRPAGSMTTAETLSEMQGVAGTLPYMAPEQLRDEPVDPRSDIFSLGAVLYEMATGQRAFRESIISRLTDAILHQSPVPPRALNPRISPELEQIILKCLEKEPERRYQSAKEVGVDLRRLAAGASAPATAVKPQPGVTNRKAVIASGLGAGVLLVLAGLLIGSNVGRWRERLLGKANTGRIESLAVLPLENLSRDPEQAYFADGITEELITDLAQIGALRVTSRTSVMQYKGARKPLPQIGKELHVDAVVEGSVQRAGDRVRITAQLVDAATDKHLWAKSYERNLSDVLALQNEVAGTIANEIKITLTPQEQARLASARVINPEAHEAYLLGRYYWVKGDEASLKKSIDYFRQALAKDPNYAQAYAGLADSYAALSSWYFPPRAVMPQAKTAAMKALELDDTLAEAHNALGWIHFSYDWDGPASEKEFKRALQLNPNLAEARVSYAQYLAAMGHPEEADKEVERAMQLDPLSSFVYDGGEWAEFIARRYDRVIEMGRKATQIDPNNYFAHTVLGWAYAEKGQFTEAIAENQKAVQLDDSPLILAYLGSAYAFAGQKAEARKVLAQLHVKMQHRYVCTYEVAMVYLLLGEKDQAFGWFEKAYEDRSDCMPFLGFDPRLDSIRSDPRFRDLLRRVGFLK